jgi:hypothetical protein
MMAKQAAVAKQTALYAVPPTSQLTPSAELGSGHDVLYIIAGRA